VNRRARVSGASSKITVVAQAPLKASAPDPGPALLKQLERVLNSHTFHQVDRLKRFLAFIVNEAVAGRRNDLKEYVVGVQVFGKEESFDPRTDPIVRVQARRLRNKLVNYYRDEGRSDDIIIELPKGGYVPVFKPRETTVLVRRAVTPSSGSNTTIVMPFADHTPGATLDYFCKGVREEIIHHLTRFQGLSVLASDAVEASIDSGDSRRSEAALLIGGSVRQAGPRLRITAHIIDNANGRYLWSESVDGEVDEAFSSQERVAERIAKKVESELTRRGHEPVVRPSTENLAAQNLYLQGRYHLNQRTEEGLLKGLEFFEKALVEDAQFALAHSGLADAYGLLAHYGVLGPAEAWTKAATSAATAVHLDPESAEAHTSLAHVKSTQNWDWTGAEREFQFAIRANPRYATAHHWYAMSCLAPLGRLDDALEEMVVAQSMDPVSSIVARDLAMVHFYRKDFETALEQCDHAIELNPHFAPAYWILGVIQEQRKDLDEAAAAFQRAVALSPRTPRMHGALGRTFALAGRKKQALEVLRKLESYAAERYVSPVEFAWIQFALGDLDTGFRWLLKGLDDRAFDLISVKVDPRYDALRSDRRFSALTREMGVD
jgi:TolB-like protein/Flp pilus assembly protein TadD